MSAEYFWQQSTEARRFGFTGSSEGVRAVVAGIPRCLPPPGPADRHPDVRAGDRRGRAGQTPGRWERRTPVPYAARGIQGRFALTGEWRDHRECHIQPDWLLIYRTTATTITYVSTGTHADFFGR
jgi:hypothetical protein